MTLNLLAFDLGAESGRAMLGRFDGACLSLEEIHRFGNGGVRVGHSLHWDVLRLWSEIKHGLGLAAPYQVASIGLDTWGVDFGLLDRNDQLLGNPFHYRDSRTDGMMEQAFCLVERAEIFEQTGIQFMPINTLYQLLAMRRAHSAALDAATALLMMPDLFNFWLTGRKASDMTMASTSQCYNPRENRWAMSLLEKLDVPVSIFQALVSPATILGSLAPTVAVETGLQNVRVIAPAGHDTAAAVAAVPASSDDYAYLSSGTWSLMGVETSTPIITPAALANNFTNEVGVAGTIRFLKNIMGLWLIQECRRAWATPSSAPSYAEIMQSVIQARPFIAFIDPDDARFLHPPDMPAQIQAYCAETRQPVPATRGEIARTIFEGLALKYRWTLERIQEMLGRRLATIHIVGGGTQNQLLCQFTADATARPVLAGPIEATAIGNLLLQALALGQLSSVADARQVVRQSFPVSAYEPHDTAQWDDAYEKFLRVIQLPKEIS